MKLCKFKDGNGGFHPGLIDPEAKFVFDLRGAGVVAMEELLEDPDPVERLRALISLGLNRLPLSQVCLGAPIERQEVWAAGVTYLRSKTARMEESAFSASAYDRVYEAERPELFFKALPAKVVGPNDTVGIRADSRWSVPEPELALVFNSRGALVGYTIGLDMSSRDIEGENLLYLPQAKIYDRSCALGPWITLGVTEAAARLWEIQMTILRAGAEAFSGRTSAGQIKRAFESLGTWLFRSQNFPHGAVLLTGTGIVPPDSFTLEPGDAIRVAVDGVGVLNETAVRV